MPLATKGGRVFLHHPRQGGNTSGQAEGKRYPLASLLLIAIAAILAGRRDQLSIVRWGRRSGLFNADNLIA